MANAQDFTSFFKDLPFALDTGAATDAFKTWARFNERFAGIALEAANKSNDITVATMNETFSKLRNVTKAQDDPAEYAKVLGDFNAAQADVVTKHFESLGEVAKQAQNEVSELFVSTGKQVAEESTKAASKAGEQTKAAAEKAVKSATAA